ncbi:hypothetical protein, partial [Sulfobacillus harzensis]|uniref:hypothetical protein n=1 Tax=Sulfobacillus harzensis TaxID=2729629 RepID=UPI001A9AD60C
MGLVKRFGVTLLTGLTIVSAAGCGPGLSTGIEPAAPIPIARQWVTAHTDSNKPLKFIGVAAKKQGSRYWPIDFRAEATLTTHVQSHEITVPKDSIVRVVLGRSPNYSIASRDSVLQMGQGFCPERQGHLPP